MCDALIGDLMRQLERAEAAMMMTPADDVLAIMAALHRCDALDARLTAMRRKRRTERAIESQALRSYADAV